MGQLKEFFGKTSRLQKTHGNFPREQNGNLFLDSGADNLCKQFGPRSGPKKCGAWSGFNLFDTQIVLLKVFEKNDFEKNQQSTK